MNVLKKGRYNWARNEFAMLAIIIVATVLLMGILNPSRFFRITNLQSMAFQLPELGLLSLGMIEIRFSSWRPGLS